MRRGLLALLALVIAAGCAAIPTSGPVRRVAEDTGLGESTVRYSPPGPAPGASGEQIVHGFLDAMLAYPVTHRVAAEFLTPEAAQQWRPGAGTLVYRSAQVSVPRPGAARVELAAHARLDAQGRWSSAERGERLTMRLERVEGQWRIADPPEGVLVDLDWFENYVRPFDLYFLDESGSRLVPVPVFEVVGDQLATSLMASLAIGPREATLPGLTTAVPSPADLRPSVPVVDGVAEVDFVTRVGDLSAAQQRQLSAQVAWTLRQAPPVTGVQITGEGTVVAPSGDAVQDAEGWASFGPDRARRQITVIADGAAWLVGRRDRERLPGPWGQDAQGATAVVAGGDVRVAVWDDRAEIVIDGVRSHQVGAVRPLRPVIDIEQLVWLVDRPGARTRIRVADVQSVTSVATPPELADLTSFSVSPDGARYAATAAGQLLVGGISRRDGLAVGLSAPVRLPAADAREAVWANGSRVAHLDPLNGQVRSIRIDGTGAVDAWPGAGRFLPQVQPTDLVATPAAEADLYLRDADGGLWLLDGSQWRPADIPAVTGLG